MDAGGALFQNFLIPDHLQEQWLKKAAVVKRTYLDMGYDAVNVGLLDLAEGVSFLAEADGAKSLPLVSANLVQKDSKEPLFDPYLIKTVNGIKFGIFGLLEDEFSYIQKMEDGLVIEDPIEAARQTVQLLRGTCDFIVALVDLRQEVTVRLAYKVPGIDIIIGGSDSKPIRNPSEYNGALPLHAGSQGKYIGQLELIQQDPAFPNRRTLGSYSYIHTLTALDKNIKSYPKIQAMVDRYKAEIRQIEQARLITDKDAVEVEGLRFVSDLECRMCHEGRYEFWLSTPHARAYQTLQKAGQELDPECIGCHTVGYLTSGGFWHPNQVGNLKDVQCESCHGAGSQHLEGDIEQMRSRTVKESACLFCHTDERDDHFNFAATFMNVCQDPSRTSRQ